MYIKLNCKKIYLLALLAFFSQSVVRVGAVEGAYVGLSVNGVSANDKQQHINNGVGFSVSGLAGYNLYSEANINLSGEVDIQYLLGLAGSKTVRGYAGLRGKAHYRFGYFSPYLAAGVNYGYFSLQQQPDNTAKGHLFGIQYGLGVNYIKTRQISYFVEMRQIRYLKRGLKTSQGTGAINLNLNEFRAGINYYF